MKRLFTLLFITIICQTAFSQLNCDNTIICDDFDLYVTGALGPQADHWTTWSGDEGGAEDGIVTTDAAYSGSNSFLIQGQNGPQDVLLLLGNLTTGNYRLDMKMNIFEGQRGYWNLQKDETPAVQWGQEVYFTEDGTGSIDAAGADAAQFTFPHGEWFDISQFIDLDNDRATLFIAGQAVHDWQFSQSSQAASTPINQIGAIDFFAISEGNHLFYIDDVRFSGLTGNDALKRMVQINVDMSLEDVSPDGVNIAGSFNGWTPAPMENIGNGIWQAYVPVDENTEYMYKFVNGSAFEGGKEACGVDDGFGGYNRTMTTDTSLVLEAVCFNQCVPCSEVSGTDAQTLNGEISISPNPASSEVWVNYQVETVAELTIHLTNLMGQSILEREIGHTTEGTEMIDLGGVPSGVYFLQLHDGQKQLSQKLIVE